MHLCETNQEIPRHFNPTLHQFPNTLQNRETSQTFLSKYSLQVLYLGLKDTHGIWPTLRRAVRLWDGKSIALLLAELNVLANVPGVVQAFEEHRGVRSARNELTKL